MAKYALNGQYAPITSLTYPQTVNYNYIISIKTVRNCIIPFHKAGHYDAKESNLLKAVCLLVTKYITYLKVIVFDLRALMTHTSVLPKVKVLKTYKILTD